MILLFTDFSYRGPYVGQLHAVLAAAAPDVEVVDLQHDAPAFAPLAAGHLLAALEPDLPRGAIVVAVVDPGVGSSRRPLLLEADERRYVGPDNGLLATVARRAKQARAWEIDWRPPRLSASFHGRDLFAPAAGRLATGMTLEKSPLQLTDLVGWSGPEELSEVIYLDGYGNAWTGLRAGSLPGDALLAVNKRLLRRARTFSDVEKGEAFWYENASSLVEIAVNQGSAASKLNLGIGTRFDVRPASEITDVYT